MDPQAAQDQAMLGMIIGIGVLVVFVIIMIIVIPKQIRKAKARGKQYAADLGKEMEVKTGLKPVNNGFEGNYKGYHLRIEKGMGSNKAAQTDASAELLGNFFGTTNSTLQQDSLHGRSTVYPTLKVFLTAAGQNFPDVTLFQSSNFFLNSDEYRNNRINGRIPDEKKLDIDADPLHKKANFYGDEQGAQKMLSSVELKQAINDWVYPDIRAEGEQIVLELNHSNIINKLGYKKTSGTDWMVQAADICVATANALKN